MHTPPHGRCGALAGAAVEGGWWRPRAVSLSRLVRDAYVLAAVAVRAAADADEQDEAAGGAGADGGGCPVEALVDALHDGRGRGLDDDRPARRAGRRAARLAVGAASAPAMRPAVTRRVMRCETFMTASFRGGRGFDAAQTFSSGSRWLGRRAVYSPIDRR